MPEPPQSRKKTVMIGVSHRQSHGVFVLAFLSAAWAVMSFWDFGLPGLYFDEVNHYAFIPGILSEEAARLPHYRLADNWFDLQDGHKRFPILGGTIYNSLLRTYIGLPFFLVAGFSVEALRIFSALIGLAALVSSASLIGRTFGWLSALLFGLVVVTDPTNIFSLRSQGGLFWMVIFFSATAGHALLSAWQRRDRPPWWTAAVAGASISLAVASYFVGVFIAIPLVACGILAYWRHPRMLLLFLGAGIVAYLPVLYALASIYLQTPQHFSDFGHPSLVKERPPMFGVESLRTAFGKLEAAWGSHRFAAHVVGGLPADYSRLRIAALLTAMVAWAIAVACRKVASNTQVAVLTVVLVASAIYLMAVLALGSLNLHHLIPLAVMAVMAVCCLVALPGFPRLVGFAATAILVATNSLSMVAAHASVQRTGGNGYHNETYAFPAYAMTTDTYSDHYPVFAGWGFHLQFLFQTRGERPYAFMARPDAARLRKLMAKHGRLAVFVNAVDREGFLAEFEPDSETRFRQRDGRYLYSIMLLSTNTPLQAR